MGVNRFDSYGFTTNGWRVVHCARLLASGWHQVLMSAIKELASPPPPPLSPPPHFRATLPPEEDLQTYKRSLVRFRYINASGSRIIADKLQHPTPKFSLEEYWVNNNNIYLSIYLGSEGVSWLFSSWGRPRSTSLLPSIYFSNYLSMYLIYLST